MRSSLKTLAMDPWALPVFIVCMLGIASPRSMAVLVPVLLLAGVARALTPAGEGGTPQDNLNRLIAAPGGQGALALCALGAFALWALLSAFWSNAPSTSASKALYLLLMLVCMTGFAYWREQAAPVVVDRAAQGLLVAFCLASVLMAIEVRTNQGLSRGLMTLLPLLQDDPKHLRFDKDGVVVGRTENEINRRTAVLTFLVWPVLLVAVRIWWPEKGKAALAAFGGRTASVFGRLGWLPIAVAMLAAGIAVMLGGHQSSQTALLAGIAAFALAKLRPRAAVLGAAATWTALVLLIVPLVMTAHANRMHEAPWLFGSARHRVVIWNHTVERIALKPLAGIGADATPSARPWSPQARKEGGFDVSTGRHAHNAYLQVWYELGSVGALLFLAAGLALVALIGSLPATILPWALAQAATTAIMAATSYSIWQVWFQASMAAGVAALMLAAVAAGRRAV